MCFKNVLHRATIFRAIRAIYVWLRGQTQMFVCTMHNLSLNIAPHMSGKTAAIQVHIQRLCRSTNRDSSDAAINTIRCRTRAAHAAIKPREGHTPSSHRTFTREPPRENRLVGDATPSTGGTQTPAKLPRHGQGHKPWSGRRCSPQHHTF